MSVQAPSIYTMEIIYRGVHQRHLARNLSRGIVYAARMAGNVALSYQRYGDDPERDGMPAKYFVVIAKGASEDVLDAEAARVEPDYVDISIVLDDSLLKGVESWAWQGIQPVHLKLRPGGLLIVVSKRSPDELIRFIPARDSPYTLVVVYGERSIGDFWTFPDDGTVERVLGAIARAAPDALAIDDVRRYLESLDKPSERVGRALEAYQSLVKLREVKPGEGLQYKYEPPHLPGWKDMMIGAAIPGLRPNQRNPYFTGGTAKHYRPVINFDKCIKCSLCWEYCPDSVFDVTPDGYFNPALAYCKGCGICAEVCPVPDTIIMVDEMEFEDGYGKFIDEYRAWKEDRDAYRKWFESLLPKAQVVSVRKR